MFRKQKPVLGVGYQKTYGIQRKRWEETRVWGILVRSVDSVLDFLGLPLLSADRREGPYVRH